MFLEHISTKAFRDDLAETLKKDAEKEDCRWKAEVGAPGQAAYYLLTYNFNGGK